MSRIIKIIDSRAQVVEDAWSVVRDMQSSSNPEREILPFSCLAGLGGNGVPPLQAIWLAPDDDFESHARRLGQLALIAVDFPSFRDGRGYSIGYLLRTRYGWQGELRAIGDLLRVQLNYMHRCGFDAFAVRADKDIADALNGFSPYSVQYQGAVDQPLPLFRRR